jgi:hypothetical protein
VVRARWIGLALLLLMLAGPEVSAQGGVDRCAHQCDAKAPDVNPSVPVSEGSVNVILYGHVENILSRIPMNTIPPDPAFETDVDEGFLVPTLNTKTGTPADVHFKNGEFTFYSCPGPVTPLAAGWRLGCHMNGLGGPLVLGANQIPAYFYISADPGTIAPSVGAIPNMVMRAQMYTGMRDGTLVADSGSQPTGTMMVSRPGAPSVYELKTFMRTLTPAISATHGQEGPGFRVEVSVYQVSNAAVDFAQSYRVHSGPLFPPRVIVPVIDPLWIQDETTRVENNTIHYYVQVQSVLGAYDVDIENATLRAEAGGQDLSGRVQLLDIRRSLDHDGVNKPILFHYEVTPGDVVGPVDLAFTVRSLQGTYELRHAQQAPYARFDGIASIPGLPLTQILALLVGLSLLRRRD